MPAPTYENYHVFSLPRTLLQSLTLLNLRSRLQHTPEAKLTDADGANGDDAQQGEAGTQANIGSRACNICLGAVFATVDEQRAHFRSDWHRYNVKIRIGGGQPVNEARFGQLIEGFEGSLSGSASSTSEDEDSDDAVSNLLSRTRLSKRSSRTPSPDGVQGKHSQSPLVWFHSPPSLQLGIYKMLLSDPTGAEPLQQLLDMQSGHGEGRLWALFMVAGGHFAGAIVRVSRSDEELEAERLEEEGQARLEGEDGKRKKKTKMKKPKPETEVLMHKTFHRYTTRRKQGGSQSVNDNAKHKAKSAGAQLRRYGEQALRDDIQNLLREWADEIADCERIWIRASWSNRRMFMQENGGIIEKGDERLRGFPFPTRRPTQSEVARCLSELVRVKITHFTEQELREQDEAYLASLPKPKVKPAPATTETPAAPVAQPARPTLTGEQQVVRQKWIRVLDMIRRGRLDALRTFFERDGATLGGLDARVPEWLGFVAGGDEEEERARGRTPLMLAAAAGQEEIVRWLLDDGHADPTLDVPRIDTAEDDAENAESDDEATRSAPGSRRTAYDLARTKEVRNVFRRSAGADPGRWDWLGAARVPSALTKEMEENRDDKKKARRKGLKDKIREREAKEKEREEQVEEAPRSAAPAPAVKAVKDGPQKLGGTGSEGSIAGLTPEMRAKVERERRARAAEARLKALGGR